MIKNGLGPRTTVQLRSPAKKELGPYINVPFTFTNLGLWYIQEDCFACWMFEPSTVCETKFPWLFSMTLPPEVTFFPSCFGPHASELGVGKEDEVWSILGNFNGIFGNSPFNGDVDFHHFKVSISFCLLRNLSSQVVQGKVIPGSSFVSNLLNSWPFPSKKSGQIIATSRDQKPPKGS